MLMRAGGAGGRDVTRWTAAVARAYRAGVHFQYTGQCFTAAPTPVDSHKARLGLKVKGLNTKFCTNIPNTNNKYRRDETAKPLTIIKTALALQNNKS